MVSQWFNTPYSIVNFGLRVKSLTSASIIVVLEAENGKFYTVGQEVGVSVGGGGG